MRPVSSPVDHSFSPQATDPSLERVAARPRPPAREHRVDPKLQEASEAVEEMFLTLMLDAMRKTVPVSDAQSSATQIYTQMFDSQIAHEIAQTGNIGLSQQFIESVVPK
jgi:Rod binding domain-containing protein